MRGGAPLTALKLVEFFIFFAKFFIFAFHNVGTMTTVALSIARKSLIVR